MKKRNKKHNPITTVKLGNASAKQQIQYFWGNSIPKCTICETKCELATDEEIDKYKTFVDPSYAFKFMWVPNCNCYEKHDNWMGV